VKKFLFILFIILSTNVFAADTEMNFTKDAFETAQKAGKTVVVNSWNKWCYTCVKQEKIIKEAKKDFNDVLFLSYAQKNKDIAKYLNIDYRSTIVIYKDNKEIARAVGIIKKEEIYSLIQKGI
jgi:thiol-disulfide isomerase/thioredoxin|tara:strand:- start:112 stop:480 length:369 start_codon:yes stop_codon:yes gene_type:complete